MCLWFLCKIKLNVLYSPKNIIFNKLLFLYFYTYFFKQKYLKNDLILFNSNKHLDVNSNYFLFRYDSLTFSTKYLYNYFYIYYFFNQKFTELNKTKQFNKFFNKYYIFFFMCFKNFINGELLFYKNLNNNFLELTFKNLKKFNRINDSKFFKKNLFSKIHFFKLKKSNDRIKYFNKNILFYFYFLKKYKNSILLQASTDIFFKTKFRFYFSEIYLYKNLNLLCLHNLYKNNLQTVSINYNFNKSFFLNIYKNIFFKNYMYNNKSLIYKKYTYFDSNLNHINLDFKKINFFYGFSLCNNVNILKKKLLQLKIYHSNNKSFFNQKFILKNDIKKQQIYKLVLQLLLT